MSFFRWIHLRISSALLPYFLPNRAWNDANRDEYLFGPAKTILALITTIRSSCKVFIFVSFALKFFLTSFSYRLLFIREIRQHYIIEWYSISRLGNISLILLFQELWVYFISSFKRKTPIWNWIKFYLRIINK